MSHANSLFTRNFKVMLKFSVIPFYGFFSKSGWLILYFSLWKHQKTLGNLSFFAEIHAKFHQVLEKSTFFFLAFPNILTILI